VIADELLTLCDLNNAQSWRDVVRWTPRGALAEEDDLLLGASATSAPGFNRALRTSAAAHPSAREVIDRGRAYFSARERGFLVEARDHADRDLLELARAAGYKVPREPLPVMVLDHEVAEPPLAPSLTLRIIETRPGSPTSRGPR
jgi:hypothetical protein